MQSSKEFQGVFGSTVALIVIAISLMLGSMIVCNAQQPKLTKTVTSSNKYGEGGTLETVSDEKLRLHEEYWKDKDGIIREVHLIYYNGKDVRKESWHFGKGAIWSANYSYSPANGVFGIGYDDPVEIHAERAQAEQWIEQIEKQFAKDGTTPTPWERKDKEAETSLEQPKPDGNTFRPAYKINGCLVGKWTAVSVRAISQYISGGGTGFNVTFSSDGSESVDYTGMRPFEAGEDRLSFIGKASGILTTTDTNATVVKITNPGVTMNIVSATGRFSGQLPGLGPGGLGSAADDNSFTCKGDVLNFRSTTSRTGKANVEITMTRVK